MKLPLVPLTLSALVISARAQDLGPQKPQQFTQTVTKTHQLGYLLYLPADYQTDNAKKWPLVLFLHGAGERGTDIAKVAVHGPPKLVKEGKDFPFILVSPQCPENEQWQAEMLTGLLDKVIASQRVDTNRVYVTGLSMGGYGTWALLAKFPGRFAAAAPICGGGERIDLLLAGLRANAIKSLGVWAFHGGRDAVVPPDESERMVEALKKLGHTDVKLTVYPEANHDSWTETYNNPEFYEWLLKHRR